MRDSRCPSLRNLLSWEVVSVSALPLSLDGPSPGRASTALPVCSAMSDSLPPHGRQPAGLLSPWTFAGKNPGVGCHFLLQGLFPTQRSNLGLLLGRQTLYHCTTGAALKGTRLPWENV